MGNSWSISFTEIPASAAEFRLLMPEAMRTPQGTAALFVLAASLYNTDPNNSLMMIKELMGPRTLSGYDRQFYRDRLTGKPYLLRSYFAGATPDNNYTPSRPYTINVSDNRYSYDQPDYARLFVHSSGADMPRPIVLRRKPSTGQWFLWEQLLLADVRQPLLANPWA